MPKKKTDPNQGRLRIGNQWNAIRIIALSQNNPLKAIAEFVENSIDAGARNISIVRGKSKGEQYLKVIDDGAGITDFRYVATHIGDSIKRRLKERGQDAGQIQGEFGIGLLSFWTVGEELTLSSCPPEGQAQRLHLVKDSPDFAIKPSRELFERSGTTLHVQPLLPGVRSLTGEKIQSYLASELRDRISRSGVTIRIVDRTARKDLLVEPRRYHGRLLHDLPLARTPLGEVYVELYLTEPGNGEGVALHRQGTRVLPSITEIDIFRKPPWTGGYLEGIIDCSFLQLTPGTRTGLIFDSAFDSFVDAIDPIEDALIEAIGEYRRAEDEEASKAMLKRITKALKEAFSMLPAEEYGWLSVKDGAKRSGTGPGGAGQGGTGTGGAGEGGASAGADGSDRSPADVTAGEGVAGGTIPDGMPTANDGAVPGVTISDGAVDRDTGQRAFFEFPGPLYRVDLRPAKVRVAVAGECKLQAVPKDKSRRIVDSDVTITWMIVEGLGTLSAEEGEFVSYNAPKEPELATIRVVARQEQIECSAEATVTVTAELAGGRSGGSTGTGAVGRYGLPGYTYRYAPGEFWRSQYDPDQSLITVNSGHADFVFASRQSASKLRYVGRLFAKEIVLANFPGAPPEDLLERMIELELYMDRSLR